MIEVSGLTKKYGKHMAVSDLNFRVEKGRVYGFLGPNGAGKSTTMNMITGYLAATSGSVLVNGKDVVKEPEEAKKCIGYLPEIPPLYMDMTVLEYLKFVAELKKVPKAERASQLKEVMEMTQIEDKKDRLIKNLSKGYRQRVGLAQAVLGFPEVIILDEPTVGLDPKQIIEIRDLIHRLKEKHTIILSSHILSEVSAICDHIMIMSHGKLVASDTPEGLQEHLGKDAEIRLTLKGHFETAKVYLQQIDGVEKVELLAEEDDHFDMRLTVEEGRDVREEIFYKLVEAKMPILGMQRIEKTLEDIFLELTGDADNTEQEDVDEIEEEQEESKSKAKAKRKGKAKAKGKAEDEVMEEDEAMAEVTSAGEDKAEGEAKATAEDKAEGEAKATTEEPAKDKTQQLGKGNQEEELKK